jgi:hypothetical protein
MLDVISLLFFPLQLPIAFYQQRQARRADLAETESFIFIEMIKGIPNFSKSQQFSVISTESSESAPNII